MHISDGKETILHTIAHNKIVACIRTNSYEKILTIADSLIAADINIIEITLTSPDPFRAIAIIRQKYPNVLVGAGTVLNADAAKDAIRAGASFIVSPILSREVMKIGKRKNVLSIPGVFTPTEICTAINMGAEIVKLFPASIGSPSMIREIKAPFPDIRIMPSGGVTLDNAREWLAAGAFALTLGSALSSPASEGNFDEITRHVRQLRKTIEKGDYR
ncbi:MAG TPA: bifunctional 4-hydroxy-2-oxoglutarate aldolase/2-dehydro-3-deoxy-phosphogluconate aldolase [Spirochaetota bacterium]